MDLSTAKPNDISFIFTDLDQTLLVDNHISQDNLRVMQQFLSNPKHHMAIASARPVQSLDLLFREVGFRQHLGKNLHLTGYNGGVSYFQNEQLLEQPMPQEQANTLVLNTIRHDVPAVFFTDKGIIATPSADEWAHWYFAVTGYQKAGVVGNFEDILNPTTKSYLAEFHRHYPEEDFKAMMGICMDTMNYANFKTRLANPPSNPDIVQVSSKQTDKSHALHAYIARLDVNPALVLGDAFNDVAALTTPGIIPVTFKDAFPDTILAVQNVSGYIAPPAEKSGFYHALTSLVRM